MTSLATGFDSWTRFRRIGRWVLLGLVAWFALAYVAIPALIYLAHRTGVPVPGDLMAGRIDTPVSSYMEAWQGPADRFSGFLIRASAYVLALSALGAFATNTRRQRSNWLEDSRWLRPCWTVAALCIAGVMGTLALQYWFPVAYSSLVVEDGLGEQATFFCWISIPILLAQGAAGRMKPAIVVFGFASFVIGMEEVSWGQRLIGLETPAALGQVNYQDELTVHNLEALRPVFEYQSELIVLVIVLGTFLIPWAVKSSSRFRVGAERIGIPRVPRYLWPAAITVSAIVLTRLYAWGSEIDELATALFAACVALSVVFESTPGARIPSGRESFAIGCLAVLILGGGLVTQRSDLHSRIVSMATRKYPLEGMYKQSVMLFEYFEGRPEYAYDRFGIDYAEALTHAGRPDEARGVLERDLAARVGDGALSAEKQRAIGEVLILLSRPADADLAFRQGLELDQSALASTSSVEEASLIRWSLAKTYRLLGDSLEVEREMELALQTPNLRDQQQMQLWFDRADGSRFD